MTRMSPRRVEGSAGSPVAEFERDRVSEVPTMCTAKVSNRFISGHRGVSATRIDRRMACYQPFAHECKADCRFGPR